MTLQWTWGYSVSLWDPAFISFGHISRSGIAGSYGNSIFNFFRESPYHFHSGCTMLYSFTFLLADSKGSNFSTASLTLVILCVFDSSHLEVVSQWVWWYFPGDQWWTSFFLGLIVQLCIFFGKCLFKSFAHFWIGLVVRCCSCMISLYVLDRNLL